MKNSCPYCRTTKNVKVFDKGFKRIRRFFSGNNRYYCKDCLVTWRKKSKDRVHKLKTHENLKTAKGA